MDHHVADHLAADAGRGGDPTDDLAVDEIEGKARRTTSPFQQVNSRPSEHQRILERSVATWSSCSRRRRRPAADIATLEQDGG